jgi:hypothetical protein
MGDHSGDRIPVAVHVKGLILVLWFGIPDQASAFKGSEKQHYKEKNQGCQEQIMKNTQIRPYIVLQH